MNPSTTPAHRGDPNPRSPKRVRTNDDDSRDKALTDQQIVLRDFVAEPSKTREDLDGGVPVIDYLKSYTDDGTISVNMATRLLQGVTIRKTDGRRYIKFTFHGVSKSNRETLEDMTANRYPIDVPMQQCAVFIKDNESNERLRRLVSGDNLMEYHYLDNRYLEKKWRLIFLGLNAPMDTLDKFRNHMAAKCGEPSSDEIIHISNEAELRNKLPKVERDRQILLCVMEKKQDNPFYSALKQEAELEKKILTKCCHLKILEDYSEDQEETTIVTQLWLQMVANLGAYKAKAFFLHSALPPRFGENCKVMYLGCNLINSDPQIAVMAGNIGPSGPSTSQYESRVGRGDYMENLGAIFRELLGKYEAARKSLPDKIILFREGFIGGQIEETLRKERDALRNEVDDLRKEVDALRNEVDGLREDEAKYVPITFIVGRKLNGTRSVSVRDGKASYSIFSDENGLFYNEFETVIRNLSYSRRYPKPLPAHYAKRAVELAEVYLEGKEDVDADKMDEIAKAIDRSLYVIGEREVEEMQE
ncbi:hypothetical protein SUGI_0814160 [Cryptomeria japonica]|nr:hypothetical protein SUGI_0814160 [Cryptomeria japonica]